MNKTKVGVLTVSDRCAANEAKDESGPNLVSLINAGIIKNATVVRTGLVPDNELEIQRKLKEWCDEDKLDVVLTTGGTGIAERDVTPEATAPLLDKKIPGISGLILKMSLDITPFAALSRGEAGVRGQSLIINLPGSKKGSEESLKIVSEIIPHSVDLIQERKKAVENVHSVLTIMRSKVKENPANVQRALSHPMVSVKNAQTEVTNRAGRTRKMVELNLENAAGYVLAESVCARDSLPPFKASILDGYAIISTGKGSSRKLIGTSNMGTLSEFKLTPETCVEVSTGAPVPDQADVVAGVEFTTIKGDEVIFQSIPSPGSNIRFAGSDFEKNELILEKGTQLKPPALGLLAAAGVTAVKVFSKPTVGVLSTGNEIVSPNVVNLPPGKVRDSNLIYLTNILKEEGFTAFDLGIVPDEPNALCNALAKGFRAADILVTTGSMSMGKKDYLKEILVQDFNAELCFGAVHMKPGKPTAFAVVEFECKTKMWFGLPGNPASAAVTSHLFLLPALRKISGFDKVFPTVIQAILDEDVPFVDRPHYHRGILYEDGKKLRVKITGNQRSSRIGSCVNANCFFLTPVITDVPHEPQYFSKGTEIDVFVIDKF